MVTQLDDYSRVIEEAGRRHRDEEAMTTKAMEQMLPEALAKIPEQSDAYLLELYVDWRTQSWGLLRPKRQKAMYRLLRQRARQEILRRMRADGDR